MNKIIKSGTATYKIDLTGKKIGRLSVIKFSHSRLYGNRKLGIWQCLCECGNIVNVTGKCLRSGESQSCGCYRDDMRLESVKTHGHSGGGELRSEYNTWQNIKQRCSNPNRKCSQHYVGKGIKVCKRWLNSFENFISDMGPKPSPKHTIERNRNNLGYSPSNCRWATRKEQYRNTGRNVWITYNGKKQILTDWAIELNVPLNSISFHLKKGVPFSELYKRYIK